MVIEVFDFSGRNLFSSKTYGNNFQLERNGLNNGMYLLKITNKAGKTSTQSIIFN